MIPLCLPGFEPAKREREKIELKAWTKREYQLRFESKFFELIDKKGRKSPLAVMATGTGKTRSATMGVVRRWIAERRGAAIWGAHLNTLISQTRGNMSAMLGEFVGLEQGNRQWESERVCVASIASLYSKKRMSRIKNRPTLFVYDEAHHSVSEQNARIVEEFRSAHPELILLGLTATPLRKDKVSMNRLYDSLAINYPLKEAVDDGYLVPILVDMAEIPDLDFSTLSRREFTEENKGAIIGRDKVLNSIIEATLDRIGNRHGPMFWPTVKVAHLASEIFNKKRPGCSTVVDGTSMVDELKYQRIEEFKQGKFQIMNNVGVLAEGFDYANIRFVGLCSHTESVSTYLQQLGRGTRNVCDVDLYATASERRFAIEDSKKPNLLVIDYVGNVGRFDIVTAIDALADSSVDKETIAKAKIIAKDNGPSSLDDLIDNAKSSIKREKDEADRISNGGTVDIRFRRVDPFKSKGGVDAPVTAKRALKRDENDLPEFLKEAGFKPDKMSFEEQINAKESIEARKKQKLCSFKQMNKLAGFKIDASNWKSGQAGACIGYMIREARGGPWKRPPDHVIAAIDKGS